MQAKIKAAALRFEIRSEQGTVSAAKQVKQSRASRAEQRGINNRKAGHKKLQNKTKQKNRAKHKATHTKTNAEQIK